MKILNQMILALTLVAMMVPLSLQAQSFEEMQAILRVQEQINRAVVSLDRNLNQAGAIDRIDELIGETKALIDLLEKSRSYIIYFQVKDSRTVRVLTKKAHFALVVGRDVETASKYIKEVRSLTGQMLDQTMSRRALQRPTVRPSADCEACI